MRSEFEERRRHGRLLVARSLVGSRGWLWSESRSGRQRRLVAAVDRETVPGR